MTSRVPDIVIVGGGPSGLMAAATLACDYSVVVVEREQQPGGIPRHCGHTGFGIRDMHRALTGPRYAERLVRLATRAGATVRTETMVTGWVGERSLELTSPRARDVLTPAAVVLATGARERSRAARLVVGSRPAGVLSTGKLQQMVHLQGRRLDGRVVVVGAELVGWSAVLTARHGGATPVLVTTVHEKPEVYTAMHLVGRAALRTSVATRTRVVKVLGRDRVSGVEVESLDTGARRVVGCEYVVFTGDWVPDHEIARVAGLEIDSASKGPRVDPGLRTSSPGVFAVGNLVHPVDTADVAALDGRHVAGAVRDWLVNGSAPAQDRTPVVAGTGLAWVSPGWLGAAHEAPSRGHLLAWPTRGSASGQVVVQQAGQVVAARRVAWPVSPGRVFRIPWTLVSAADRMAGPVIVGLR